MLYYEREGCRIDIVDLQPITCHYPHHRMVTSKLVSVRRPKGEVVGEFCQRLIIHDTASEYLNPGVEHPSNF